MKEEEAMTDPNPNPNPKMTDLVDGDERLVADQGQLLCGQRRHFGAQDESGLGDGPESEVRPLLAHRQRSVAHLQHVCSML
jgi:hypothetical protein